jgi:hypothetical protein
MTKSKYASSRIQKRHERQNSPYDWCMMTPKKDRPNQKVPEATSELII